jgi:Tetracyclin repressor-like, C-terminal domain
LPVDSPAELAEAAENMRRRFSAAEYPHIAETITERVTRSGYDFADEFEFGLDMMLGALEQVRGTA